MRSLLKFVVWVLGILAVVATLLYFFVFDVWTVQTDDPQFSASVLPTLKPSDVLLVARRSRPARGALVRCDDPDAPGRYVTGRIVALGGETLHIKSGRVSIDQQQPDPSPGPCDQKKWTVIHPKSQSEIELDCMREGWSGVQHGTLVSPPTTSGRSADPDLHSKVDDGKIYLLSDNRYFHLDSRDFGQLDPASCQHVVFRLWNAEASDSAQRFTFLW